MHKRIADQLNELLNDKNDIPKWMNTGRTILCHKDPGKGNAVDNHRPITCLPLMWKLLTGMISNALHDFMESSSKLPIEQKGCRRKSGGTKDQLLIDKTVLNDCRRRHTNLGMTWIDYKKAYDMPPSYTLFLKYQPHPRYYKVIIKGYSITVGCPRVTAQGNMW